MIMTKPSLDLLQIVQKCSVKLSFDKLQYKQNEVAFFDETYTTSGHKPARSNSVSYRHPCLHQPTKCKSSHLLAWLITLLKFSPRHCQSLLNQSENWQRTKYLLMRDLNISQPLHRWSKKFQVLPCWHITTQRSKLCCRQMQVSKGLGACLLQEEKLVYFASKALTDAQKGYVAIEIEITCSGLGNGEIPPLFICQLISS